MAIMWNSIPCGSQMFLRVFLRKFPELFGPIKGRALELQSQFHKLSSALYTRPGRTVSLSQVPQQRTMARLSYVVLIIAMNVLMCVLAEEETYPQKYAEFDVQGMLRNDYSREEHIKCYMQIGPCTEEQRLMSEMFGEAIQTDCKKCADGHKAILMQVRDYWLNNQPEMWQQIVVKSRDYVKNN
ncbi:ejaculatory bulb-specific protein 3-like [Temnothorax americanus]|uniref:ejaculatory bulb-specific protein 3-like n=1 Tax=Temnothorax americanus TaxID=1964332 RepID=UPI0040687C94